MKTNDKYIIAISLLSVLLIVSITIIIIGVKVISDLNDTIGMYKNTIVVCNIDLEQTQLENEELREECLP